MTRPTAANCTTSRRKSIPAPDLSPFGLTAAEAFPCIPLRKQIAQKLHAVTEIPDSGEPNHRFRDLVDLVLLSTIESPSLKLRRTCEETFRVRAKQKWPPTIAARTEWVAPLESLAREIGLEHTHAGAIVQHVTQYVREIANVKESGTT